MKRNFCAMCDSSYDGDNVLEVIEHLHAVPQSGPIRDAWIASNLPWLDFVDGVARAGHHYVTEIQEALEDANARRGRREQT